MMSLTLASSTAFSKGITGSPRNSATRPNASLERLRGEYGLDGGYTIVKDYVREHRRRTREMFVTLSHPPGHAQYDFGEALVVIGGVQRRAHCFVIDLPHSNGCFVKAYAAETTEALSSSPSEKHCRREMGSEIGGTWRR